MKYTNPLTLRVAAIAFAFGSLALFPACVTVDDDYDDDFEDDEVSYTTSETTAVDGAGYYGSSTTTTTEIDYD
ncbi:MAG: hypothetical protein WA771_12120 [Chthoniobacterales bacterium]